MSRNAYIVYLIGKDYILTPFTVVGGLEGGSEGFTLGSPLGLQLGEVEMLGAPLGKFDGILVLGDVLGDVLDEVLGIRVLGSPVDSRPVGPSLGVTVGRGLSVGNELGLEEYVG